MSSHDPVLLESRIERLVRAVAKLEERVASLEHEAELSAESRLTLDIALARALVDAPVPDGYECPDCRSIYHHMQTCNSMRPIECTVCKIPTAGCVCGAGPTQPVERKGEP